MTARCLSPCTWVYEYDAGTQALYSAEGKKVAETTDGDDALSPSQIHAAGCEMVTIRVARTEGDACAIYTHWRRVNGPFDPEEWDCDLAWPEEIGDGAWLYRDDEVTP